MPRRYTSFNALKNGINNDLKLILERDVAPIMEDILKEHIQSDIYDVYTPKEGAWVSGSTYQRRNDIASGVTHFFNKRENTVMVTSTTTASPAIRRGYSFHNRRPGVFLQMLGGGSMGFLDKTSAGKSFPRPALAKAQFEIETSGKVYAAIRRGLGGQ